MSDREPRVREGWSAEEAERFLLARERFGMRFGLDRIRRLLNVLELATLPFPAIHIVGTNGKSSTTRMTAAILERHGLRTGCFTSPHLLTYRERIRIGERDIGPDRFAAQIARVLHAAELVDRVQGAPDDRVTQFELLTATALLEFAASEVDVAVLEAGLGGRYDATNAVDSRVAVLTNVGLEHTRYLGPTVTDIAREKLDVVRPGATLIVGEDLHPDAWAVAVHTARERGAELVRAPAPVSYALRAGGAYQQRNFAVAAHAARTFLGRELDPAAVASAAAELVVPGRFQVIAEDPVVLLDGAHDPRGVDALARSLAPFVAGRRLVGVVSIMDDKDSASMLAALVGSCDALVCTAALSRRSLPAATLASLAGQLDGPPTETAPNPHDALARARELAGPEGVVLVTGSIYLLGDVLRDPGSPGGSIL